MKLIFYTCIAFFVVVIAGCKKDTISNEDCWNYPEPADTYKYPILPGTPEWATLETGDERLEACQIPDNILATISTEGLVQSWLDMPLAIEIFFANSPQRAIEFFIENFSGLRELVGRADAWNKLLEKYKSMIPACITTLASEVEQGKYTFLFSYLELPLAQDTILNKMNLNQKKELVSVALDKFYLRNRLPNHFGGLVTDFALLICARVMRNCNYSPFLSKVNDNLQWFIDKGVFPIPLGDYEVEKNIIISSAKNFLK